MSITPVEKRKPTFITVEQLRPDSSGHNLAVKVVERKIVLNRPGGRGPATKIAECLVGDATGVIVFTARNEQVDMLEPGKYVILRNGRIDMFKGSMRLAVDKWGKIDPAEGSSFETKLDKNLSLVEYELVQVPANAT